MLNQKELEKIIENDSFYNDVIYFETIDSTNTYIRHNLSNLSGNTLVFAKEQTKGRGRLNKSFHSPENSGIYFSLLLKEPEKTYDTSLMTMTAAVSVNRTLSGYTDDSGIKWVNDVYIGRRKVCGILTEAVIEENGHMSALILGIGININTRSFPPEIDSTATSLLRETGKEYELKEITRNLLHDLRESLYTLSSHKEEIVSEYERHLLFKGEDAMISYGNHTENIIIEGIDERGYLKVKNKDNSKEEILMSGELNVKNEIRNFRFDVPVKMLYGPGSLMTLGDQKLPGKKALIVITKGNSVKKYRYLDSVISELKRGGADYILYDRVQPNPNLVNVMEGSELAREEKCDFVVGLGGGSAVDCAKAIAFASANSGNYWDYMVQGTGLKKKPEAKPLPIIAVSTTSGTGTEANQFAVITNEETKEKLGYVNYDMYPCISVVDPDLCSSIPPKFTAYQGFDALFHAVESYLNRNSHPLVEMFALKAVEYIWKYLPRAVADGSDREARYFMALASNFAGTFMMTLTAHGIEHCLSAEYPALPHGAGLVLISEEYHRVMAEKGVMGDRYIKLAKAMGAEGDVKPLDFVRLLSELYAKTGMDSIKMSDFGITRESLPGISENAINLFRARFDIDPYKMNKDEVLEILIKSYIKHA